MTERMVHLLLGMAVGDSVGLPFEGLKAGKIARRLEGRSLRQSLFGGKGWISDDTETALLTLAALRMGGDVGRNMARLLRRWFWGFPPGVGLATVKSCLKTSVLGARADSGVNSAGNGGLMRALVAGVWAAERGLEPGALGETVCRPTHRHPIAVDASRAIAVAACLACRGQSPRAAVEAAMKEITTEELAARVTRVLTSESPRQGIPENPPGFAGYSLPIAFSLWIKHGDDVRGAIEEAVRMGGDTDSHAALAAGLCALTPGVGAGKIPFDWLVTIGDWPLSRVFIERFAADQEAVRLPWFLMRMRNIWVLGVVLGHGFMRLVR